MQLEYLRIIDKLQELRKLLDHINYRDSAIVNKMSWKYYVMLDKMCYGPEENPDGE